MARGGSKRPVWKGDIAFGLVNIPITLYPGSSASPLDFDLIDKRDMAPVGYRRINKRTGKEIIEDNIVKGYRYEDDQYVNMSDEDFKQSNVEATQTVDIVAFVREGQTEPYYYDTPYYLEPSKRAQKSYALLRETLRKTNKVAVANVVLRTCSIWRC